MKDIFRHFERRHGWILLGFYLVGVALSLVVLLPGSISGHGDTFSRSLAAAFGAFSGPFTGAIARGFQRCCWEFSLALFPFCGAFLGGGLLLQIVPLPRWHQSTVRLTGWCIGLAGWFAGIPISFLHALD
jgi:drug/metabolite transporter (DMT)-like permease